MLPRQALIYSCCATQHDDNLMVIITYTVVSHAQTLPGEIISEGNPVWPWPVIYTATVHP